MRAGDGAAERAMIAHPAPKPRRVCRPESLVSGLMASTFLARVLLVWIVDHVVRCVADLRGLRVQALQTMQAQSHMPIPYIHLLVPGQRCMHAICEPPMCFVQCNEGVQPFCPASLSFPGGTALEFLATCKQADDPAKHISCLKVPECCCVALTSGACPHSDCCLT